MFENYSQTYAASITTLAGFIGLLFHALNINIVPSDIELVLGAGVTLFGVIWQLIHRYNKGDVTPVGARTFSKNY